MTDHFPFAAILLGASSLSPVKMPRGGIYSLRRQCAYREHGVAIELPQDSEVWAAIDLYMSLAYDAAPSATVQRLLAQLRECTARLMECPGWIKTPGETVRYSLRLGNRWYPHMKLLIEPAPDGRSYLFKADTHDRHIAVAPGSKDYDAFQQLMRNNQRLAEQIENAWAQRQLQTFKEYLRRDLERRTANAASRA
jgi:hypothetical protein